LIKKGKKRREFRHHQGWFFPTAESELILNLLFRLVLWQNKEKNLAKRKCADYSVSSP
jgi:hypothetical protein